MSNRHVYPRFHDFFCLLGHFIVIFDDVLYKLILFLSLLLFCVDVIGQICLNLLDSDELLIRLLNSIVKFHLLVLEISCVEIHAIFVYEVDLFLQSLFFVFSNRNHGTFDC
jgi:hypothetical protein